MEKRRKREEKMERRLDRKEEKRVLKERGELPERIIDQPRYDEDGLLIDEEPAEAPPPPSREE